MLGHRAEDPDSAETERGWLSWGRGNISALYFAECEADWILGPVPEDDESLRIDFSFWACRTAPLRRFAPPLPEGARFKPGSKTP
jgi:hypothetical protein